VKGSALASRVTWVRLNHGQEGIERLCDVVSPGLAGALRDGVQVASWYPFSEFIELNQAIDRLYGAGDGALIKELGRQGADFNLKTIYRLFYKVGTVRWVMARAARLWHLHYDAGRLVLREMAHDEFDLTIEEFPTPNCAHCRSVQGWVERSIELSGGNEVVTDIVRCRKEGDADCCVRARWS